MGVSEWMEKDFDEPGPGWVTKDRLIGAFKAANAAHHEYEEVTLGNAHDEKWPGMYALFAIGRLGDFAKPSELEKWLQEPTTGDWYESAADNVMKHLKAAPAKPPG